jgi:hypothetical protein
MAASSKPPEQTRHRKALLAWQLALLRFALTMEAADRLALLAIARELDAPHGPMSARPAFHFFRQASVALCHAIVNPQHPGSSAALHRHLKRSDDERLRRILAAAFAVDIPGATLPTASPSPSHDLWRGLQPRGGRKRA